jgi:hypothetical protein
MSIANTYSFDPDLAIYFDESFERAGVAPSAIGSEHIASALRSVKFLFSEWQTLGIKQFQIVERTQATTAGMASFTLTAGDQDIVNMVLRRSGADSPMTRISRQEFIEIPKKEENGRPDRYCVYREYNQVTIKLWRRGENTTDTIVYEAYRRISDPGRLANTLQLPVHMLDAFASGLAMRLAQKWKPERYDQLRNEYGGRDYPNRIGGRLELARGEDRERSDTVFTVSYDRRFGR